METKLVDCKPKSNKSNSTLRSVVVDLSLNVVTGVWVDSLDGLSIKSSVVGLGVLDIKTCHVTKANNFISCWNQSTTMSFLLLGSDVAIPESIVGIVSSAGDSVDGNFVVGTAEAVGGALVFMGIDGTVTYLFILMSRSLECRY